MGRQNKCDTEVKIELLTHPQSTANNNSTPPTAYSNSTIYDSYGNEYYFGKYLLKTKLSGFALT